MKFALVMFGAATVLWAAPDCLSCHEEKSAVQTSIHGTLGCNGCHADIQAFPHPEKHTKVNCSTCHQGSAEELTKSVHGGPTGPACSSCHGDAHSILPAKDPKSTTNAANLPKTCASCHGNAETAKASGAGQVYAGYMDSIHGSALTKEGLLVSASCSSCHGTHGIMSQRNPASKTFRKNIPATCGGCHAGPLRAYAAGIHGQRLAAGDANAPVCTSCHTAHQVSRVESTKWQMKTTATCGDCHKGEFTTYRDTFHAQVSSLGYEQTARCWDCHAFHDIYPSSDPKSTVSDANRAITCQKCHKGADGGFIQYDPHANAHDAKKYPALHVASIFMNLLLSGVLGFFALHTVLWFFRSRTGTK